MKAALKICIVVITLFMHVSAYPADTGIRASFEQTVFRVAAGDSGAIILKIAIPPRSHIYGNPLGPGTGKPTTITIRNASGIQFESPRFLPPKKYYAPGDTGYVWIYTAETRAALPFNVPASARPGIRTVSCVIDALICSEGFCMPQNVTVNCSIEILPRGAPVERGTFRKSLNPFTVIPSAAGNVQSATAPPGRAAADGESHFTPRYLSSDMVTGIFQAVLFGLLAGFILNFMPCVLPVVSLKVMSFVRHARDDRHTVMLLGGLFTLGILTSFLILASLAAFMGYNWGGLFQKEPFLIAMIILVYALALSMFGLFTVNTPSFAAKLSGEKENPYIDSYVKGLLATLLATPCSGPFLGGTLAWALTQPPVIIFIIFMSVGIGMSLPYMLFAINPRVMRIIPKPGPWLEVFERIMGFFLLCTAVYLIGILPQQSIVPTLWFLVIATIGLWQYGRFGSPGQPKTKRILSMAAMACIIAAAYIIPFSIARETRERVHTETTGTAYSPGALLSNKTRGILSLVTFTADWCPNCVLVEKTALHTNDVAERLRRHGIQLMVADMTRENPDAETLLRQLGSRSIPFLAVFPPGEQFNAPLCLRDMYSKRDVINAIEQALKE